VPATPLPSRAALTAIEAAGAHHLGTVSSAHGFVPASSPPPALPASHAAWDEAAAALPALWSARSARRELRDLPLLPAEPDALPDDMLWRASIVLGNLAYGYVRCDVDDLHRMAPIPLPEAIAQPWQRVADRMGRPAAHLAYDDIVTHNWVLRDPDRADPFRIDNLDQLVPQTGNGAERSFFLINFEMAAQSATVVEAIVRAQEAAVDGEREVLVTQLLHVLDRLRHITEVSFSKIDPVVGTPEHADPAVWAKLVAPSGIPIVDDVPGISGAGAPALQLVDSFLGRTRYDTHLGQSGMKTRAWYAPNVRRFMDAVEQVQVRPLVESSGDRELQGLWQGVLDAYAGDRGYLGVHRRKVYGFIQTAFKVGRPSTASGISGDYSARAWRETHDFLDEAREERYAELLQRAVTATLSAREHAVEGGARTVERVHLDTRGTGLVYRPGDRVAVAATNTPEAVRRTLAALGARGDELLPLPGIWRAELRRRLGGEAPERVPVRTFLRHAWLRPLQRDVAKRLLSLAEPPQLHEVLEARAEDQWELADAIESMAATGYDTAKLWRAQLWDAEALARIVPPSAPRLYSISGAPGEGAFPSEVALTVGHVAYGSPGPDGSAVAREGTASTLLTRDLAEGAEVPIEVVRPQRFVLPEDPSEPVVMLAAGTGVAPFIGFLEQRAASGGGRNLLLLGVRTLAQAAYRERLDAWAAEGVVDVRLAVSGEAVDGHPPRRIDALVAEHADELWDLLQGTARFYICGQGGFAASILTALEAVAAERVGADEAPRVLRRLMADRRLMLDVFTTFSPLAELRAGERVVDASELAERNSDERGWWMAINGVVYDLTEFRHLHPGGHRIIDDYCGTDATLEYREIRHHEDPEIEAMLAMYRIGLMRRLELAGPWGIAITEGRVRSVSLVELYRLWVTRLYKVVELENTLRNDLSVLQTALTSAEAAEELTPLKVGLFYDTQWRFATQYAGVAVGSALEELWAVAAGLVDPTADAHQLRRELRAALGAPGAMDWSDVNKALRDLVDDEHLDMGLAGRVIAGVRASDEQLLDDVKQALRRGVAVFEAHGPRTLDHGAALLEALAAVPPALAAHRTRLRAVLDLPTD
jgi:sulfite reductase alpha subunit-like flavoprotein/cytochrome b involved in lipid metabolism